MKKIGDWINSHKLITILGALLLLVVQPIFVHWMFKTSAATPFWENTWGAGDLLTYIAGFEAFIGTVFLGVIAVRQNDKANELNERLLRIDEKSGIFQRTPNLKVIRVWLSKTSFDELYIEDGECFLRSYSMEGNNSESDIEKGPLNHFTFVLKNLSDFNITITQEDLVLYPWIWEASLIKYRTVYNHYVLAPQQSIHVGFAIYDYEISSFEICDANMDIIVKNNINEDFIFTIGLEIPITPPDYQFKVRMEKIVPK